MGLYLDADSKGVPLGGKGKADKLIADGAREVPRQELKWQPFLVCVVDNGPFEAAGFAYTAQEYMVFKEDRSPRPRRWLVAEAAIRAQFGADTIEGMLAEVKRIPVPEKAFKRAPSGEAERLFKKHFPDAVVIKHENENEDDYDA